MSDLTWTNRIVGYGEEAPDQLLANPLNFRIHPAAQQAALEVSLDSLGWINDVIVNKTTGAMIDGHLRVALALRHKQVTIPVKYVELSEAEEAQALLSLDPIAAMAATDKQKLDELLRTVQSDDERVQKYLSDLAEREGLDYGEEQDENPYTRKIETPIYTPKGEKPKAADLYNEKRTLELIAAIESAELPEDEKEFLRVAARRHTVLDFEKIAEYYAHSSAEVQAMMEDSALVIIDFERAIELGFVRLSEKIAEQFTKDYGTR